ncbi:MAG: uracil-DNA glycosylase family 4 [Cocleimonas sp.]|jgi:uracil-DNA glycosylase family 4
MSRRIALEDCKRCRRLYNHLQKIKKKHPDYSCKPVSAFGDINAKLLIVGLAPGLHGANASGIPFTGDSSGDFLFKTLYQYGFSSHSNSNVGAELILYNCLITNAVKCLPPQNKPTSKEAQNCSKYYLQNELNALSKGSIILALGSLAHNAVLRSFGIKLSSEKFGHNVCHKIENDLFLLDSYHCSRYNTQTKRLTEDMFNEVFNTVQALLLQSNSQYSGLDI